MADRAKPATGAGPSATGSALPFDGLYSPGGPDEFTDPSGACRGPVLAVFRSYRDALVWGAWDVEFVPPPLRSGASIPGPFCLLATARGALLLPASSLFQDGRPLHPPDCPVSPQLRVFRPETRDLGEEGEEPDMPLPDPDTEPAGKRFVRGREPDTVRIQADRSLRPADRSLRPVVPVRRAEDRPARPGAGFGAGRRRPVIGIDTGPGRPGPGKGRGRGEGRGQGEKPCR